jgi:hypothetical protein
MAQVALEILDALGGGLDILPAAAAGYTRRHSARSTAANGHRSP